MVSRFQLVALSFEERRAWEFEQERLRHQWLGLELNLTGLGNLSLLLAAVTLLVVVSSFVTGAAEETAPAWMRINLLSLGDILRSFMVAH